MADGRLFGFYFYLKKIREKKVKYNVPTVCVWRGLGRVGVRLFNIMAYYITAENIFFIPLKIGCYIMPHYVT